VRSLFEPVPVTNVLRRAFVVMPFGEKEVPKRPMVEAAGEGKAPGDSLKVDFEAVYERLLAPALRAAGCTAFRTTEEKGAGGIRKDMFFELITADLVLADISILSRILPTTATRYALSVLSKS
jgi:hypothetical protein